MKKIFATLLLSILAACNEAPADQQFPALTFGGNMPYQMNVGQVQVQENFRSSMQAPNVEYSFPITPTDGIKQWVQQRVVAAGSQGVMVVTIDDASVREQALQKDGGIDGFFTDQQEARYDGAIAVTFRVYQSGSATPDAEATVRVTRARTINEKSSAAQRDQFYYNLVKDMMMDFDAEASNRFGQYMMPFTR